MSCYEGGGTILRLAQSPDKTLRACYDRLSQWVLARQQAADEQLCRAMVKRPRQARSPQ
ncbi:MAG TPA: hypothetical protein VFB55_03400 [Verrucomicrobiae bacterium]|nr:hypothetical protein [Verrucomicrobiae bacterium]